MTKYIVDSNGLSQVLAELDSNNKVVAEYTHGIEIVSQIRNKITHYYLFDDNGNVRMLTDSVGTVSDTYDYDAFGNATASTGLTANPYRYCGEYQDETTGLYYLRARYYDSTTGRFISADSYSGTLSDPVSLHKYLYANANPIMNSDPTGYNPLFGATVSLTVQSVILTMASSSIVGGLFTMLDALSRGETDIITLCNLYCVGSTAGLVSGFALCGATALIMTGGTAAVLVQLGLGAGFTYFTSQSINGAIDSFANGDYAQGTHRILMSLLSAYGAAEMLGGAYNTINSNSVSYRQKPTNSNTSNSENLIDGKKPYSLSDKDARQWYLDKEKTIPDLIDRSLPLEQQAKQAFAFRNQFRTQTRELMSNREMADYLYKNEPNMTWEQIVEKYRSKGFKGDDIYSEIINSSQRSRKSVNDVFGVK